jgi:hypothetical protein
MELSAEFSTNAERMEQWSSTAKLRRLEVERIEALLAETAKSCCMAQPVRSETVETKNKMRESA